MQIDVLSKQKRGRSRRAGGNRLQPREMLQWGTHRNPKLGPDSKEFKASVSIEEAVEWW